MEYGHPVGLNAGVSHWSGVGTHVIQQFLSVLFSCILWFLLPGLGLGLKDTVPGTSLSGSLLATIIKHFMNTFFKI